MVPDGASGSLPVRVLDAAGNPVTGARIAIVRAPVPVPDIAQLADDRGRCSLSLPAAGGYTVQVNAEGYQPATVRLDVPGTGAARAEVSIELEPE